MVCRTVTVFHEENGIDPSLGGASNKHTADSISWFACEADSYCYLWYCHLYCPQVKEFDKPSTLLDNANSMFNMLVEDTGPVASSMLRQMAAAGPQDEASQSGASRRSLEQH